MFSLFTVCILNCLFYKCDRSLQDTLRIGPTSVPKMKLSSFNLNNKKKSVQVLENALYAKHFGRFATGYIDFSSWFDMKMAKELKAKFQRAKGVKTSIKQNKKRNKNMMNKMSCISRI